MGDEETAKITSPHKMSGPEIYLDSINPKCRECESEPDKFKDVAVENTQGLIRKDLLLD